MAGPAFTFTVALPGLDALSIGLSRMREDIADWREFWLKRFIPLFRRYVLEDFVIEGARSGSRWAALSPGYAAWKAEHAPGKGILVLSGALKASLVGDGAGSVVRATATSLEIGTTVPYAMYHQTGTRHMPQRPPLRVNMAFMTAVGGEMNRFVETVRQRRLADLKVTAA